MHAGVNRRRTWPVEVRLLALAAARAGNPGRWDGPGAEEPGIVSADQLAALVSRYGAHDFTCVSTPEEAAAYSNASSAAREQMRQRLEQAAALAVHAAQQREIGPDGEALSDEWISALFWHEYDDETRELRPHTHTIVVLKRTNS